MNKMMMTVGLLAGIAGGVNAAPLSTAQVGGNANWVLHLDVDALKATQVGKILLQRTSTGAENNKLNAMAALLGFDMRKDLGGITLYAPPGLPNGEGAIIFNGKFSGQQLETFIKADESYTSESFKGATIHSWVDKKKNNKRSYGAILNASTIVMSDSSSAVKTTLDAIGGQGPSLASQNGNKLMLNSANGAVLIAAADMTKTQANKPNAQMLKQAKSGTASIREDGNDAVASISLEADTPENAQLMNNAVRGLLALMQLDEKTDQKTKDALAATAVDLKGNTLAVTIRMSAQAMADALQKKMMEDDAKKAATKTAEAAAK